MHKAGFRDNRETKIIKSRGSLVVQWLGLHAFTAEGVGLIPRQGTKILQAGRAKGKKKMHVLKSHTNGHSSSERTETEAKHQVHLLLD